jgi:mycofactocin system glycosyltransferase
VRRLGRAGEVLAGGEPFRLVRLTEAGSRVLDGLAGGGPAGWESPVSGGLTEATSHGRAARSADALARRLIAGGLLHPVPRQRSLLQGEVAVVVPVHDDAGRVARLLHRLRGDFGGEIVVVDDGSAARHGAADRTAEVTLRMGGVLHRRPSADGPAVARNAGSVALDATEPATLVAFIDADVMPAPAWLEGLVGHFDDPDVGAAAPRVCAGRGVGHIGGALARYDSLRSPLDLGATPAMVGAHRRVSYVPSAAILCRRAALDDVGWFEPSMRFGEDVDLVRRLEAAGWIVRYEPRVRVWHDGRGGFLAFARQRFSYGTSAAELEHRHPGTVAPFEATWWGAIAVAAGVIFAVAALSRLRGTLGRTWDTCVPHRRESRGAGPIAGRPTVIGGAGTGVMAWLVATALPVRKLGAKLTQAGVPAPTRTALVMITRAQLWTAAGAATATRRVGWPLGLATATVAPRLRRPLLGLLCASELAGSLPPWHRARRGATEGGGPGRPGGLPATLALGALDDLAYGAGVWAGCIRRRSFRALSPRIGTGPERPRARQRPAD